MAASLPDELLQSIFDGLDLHARLSMLPRVCIAWRAVSLEPRSWTAVGVSPVRARHFEPCELTYVCRLFEHVVSLDLAHCHLLTDRSLALTFLQTRSLTSLDLSHCELITDTTLRALAASPSAPTLRVLRLRGNEHVSRVGFVPLASKCPVLETLELDGCVEIDDGALLALARHCSQLRVLSVRQCERLSDVSIIALAHHFPPLECLDLGGLSLLTSAALVVLGHARLSNLRQLSLAVCQGIDDGGIAALLAGCTALQRIDLSACVQLTNATLKALAVASGSQLLDLNVGFMPALTDAGVEALASGCPQLMSLSLTKCVKLTDGALLSLAAHCHELQVLDVSQVHLLSNVGVEALGSALHALRHFNAAGCYRITNRALARLPLTCHVVDSDGLLLQR
jgi:hypothetical protein